MRGSAHKPGAVLTEVPFGAGIFRGFVRAEAGGPGFEEVMEPAVHQKYQLSQGHNAVRRGYGENGNLCELRGKRGTRDKLLSISDEGDDFHACVIGV